MQIHAALARYLEQLAADGRSPHTLAQATRHIRLFGDWVAGAGLSGEIGDVRHECLAAFLNAPVARTRPDGRPKRPVSMNALRSSLRCFFAYLHRAGQIPADPSRLVRRALCSVGPPRALSVEEEQKLLAVLDAANGRAGLRDRVLFRLMLGCGLRIGSAIGLDVGDVDLDRLELRLRNAKGGREEVVFLPSALGSLLDEYVAALGPGPLFRNGRGLRLSPRQVGRRLLRWAEKADITRRISPHTLRHTLATRLYERTGDLFVVREALGHRSITSTTIYAHVSDHRLRAAIEGTVGRALAEPA